MRHRAASSLSSAFENLRLMRSNDIIPDHFVLPTILSICDGSEFSTRFALQIHSLVVRTGFDFNPFVRSSLIGFYARCSDLTAAKRVLNSAGSDDSVSWNSLIGRCSRGGFYSDALELFVEMRKRDLDLDEFTFPPVLNSSALLGDTFAGTSLHASVIRTGLEAHIHVANALVDMYAKLGSLTCARGIFDRIEGKDVVTWTSLITGLARLGNHDSALNLYHEMLLSRVDPDEFVTAAVLSSCAGSTALELGRQIHSAAVRLGFDSFLSVGNSLVSMYAKTGSIDEARTAFDGMAHRCAITWTALLVGYAQNGRGKDSLVIYDEMTRTGVRPDYVTFIGLLFACSHAGLVEAGRAHFESMEKKYKIPPGPDHYACMIDLLGRSGRVEEAVRLLDRSETEPDVTVWKALLAACRIHRHVSLAERAAEMVLKLDPADAVPYVMLSNLYSRAKRWADVARIRALMKSRNVTKEPGCSWVGVGGEMHVFHVEDRGHPRAAEIYRKADEMMGRIREEEGYVADTGWALQDEEEEGKERGLAYHSERLAVAFGLLEAPRAAPIRVYKNLRVCGDCHVAIKLVTKVYGRVIILRDANCFHHMRDGLCSCGDYW
ncbi:pentatricopeptide repeat-containing protein At3g12770-like [Typha latifolia]|uniref:pentatricopeptide repeat-containing protein At3g12770-like n=1 Tax=Typha latifolia TaxID=4733 RepID=UPI003C2E109D